MHTRESTDEMGLGDAARQVAERAGSIARLELELATLELKRKITSLGLGLGFAAAAAVLGFFALGVGLATVIAALATVFAVWLASLIVLGGLVLVIAVLAFLAVRRIKRGTPPVPVLAIEEARRTTAAIKGDGQ